MAAVTLCSDFGIEVSKDGFNWYLRCAPEIHRCSVSGRRSKNATVEENEPNEDSDCHFASRNTGRYCKWWKISDYFNFAQFRLTVEDAKEYLYSKSTKRRVHNWTDIEVKLYI